MKRFGLTLIVVLVIAAFFMTGCKSKDKKTEPAPAAATPGAATTATGGETTAAQPVDGGTLVLAVDSAVQFDPPKIIDSSIFVTSQVFSYLFRVVGQTDVRPDMATSWEYQDGGKTVVFHLRKGVMFQDDNEVFPKGQAREVVASDVVYSIQRTVTISGTQASPDLMENFISAEAPDPYTVVVKLKKPDALLFAPMRGLSTLAIVPKEAVEKLGDRWAFNPIGSGPFKFVSYTPDDQVVLVRNEAYRIRPHLDKVIFKIIPDKDTSLIALEKGEIHWMVLLPEQLDQASQNSSLLITHGTCPGSTQMQLNLNDSLLKQKEVRQAISHAVDGQAINKTVLGQEAVFGCGIAGPGVPGHDPELCQKYFQYDTTLAAKLLTDAGWKKNSGGKWEKDGQTLKLEMEIWNLPPMPKYGAAVVTQLQEFGVDAELITVEFGTWIEDMTQAKGKPIMFWAGFCGEGGLNHFYGRNGQASTMGYSNEEAFTLLDTANEIVDAAQRNATLAKATDLVYQDVPAIPLGFGVGSDAVSKKVQDWMSPDLLVNITTDFNNVWLMP